MPGKVQQFLFRKPWRIGTAVILGSWLLSGVVLVIAIRIFHG